MDNLVQFNEHHWQAEVFGSTTYVVDVHTNSNRDISYVDCDCPFEDDCKHIVAVLYEILEQWQPA